MLSVPMPTAAHACPQVHRLLTKPASSDALLFAFRRCHNYIAGNQGLQKPEAFWELLKIIFCKIQDERYSEQVQFYVSGAARRGLNGQLKVKERIDKLFGDVKKEYTQIFKRQEEIELNPAVLAYIVSQLQMYSLLDSDIDVKGKAYEEIVGSNRAIVTAKVSHVPLEAGALDRGAEFPLWVPGALVNGVIGQCHARPQVRPPEPADEEGRYAHARPSLDPNG